MIDHELERFMELKIKRHGGNLQASLAAVDEGPARDIFKLPPPPRTEHNLVEIAR